MIHRATPRFWGYYRQLPGDVRRLADQCHGLLRENHLHPSLHFKKVGRFWSARVGLHYRALAVEEDNQFVWFWIGAHSEYGRLITPR